MHMEQVYNQWKNEKKKTKKRGSFEIYKAGYHDGSYLLLLGRRKLQSFQISYEQFLLLWNRGLSF